MSGSQFITLGKSIAEDNTTLFGFEDYKWRGTQLNNMKAFLRSKTGASLIDCDNVEKVTSFGTADGEVDVTLLEVCPNAKHYVAVEPVTSRAQLTYDTLTSKYPHLKVSCYNGMFEDYVIPEEKHDVVLLAHVLYHFLDCIPETLRRSLDMLKDGGKIVISIAYGGFVDVLGAPFSNVDGLIRDALAELKVKYVEEVLPETVVNLEDKGEGYFDWLTLILKYELTREKKDECMATLRALAPPGRNVAIGSQSVWVITK